MLKSDRFQDFELIVLPHLGAAYRLARWLVRDVHDAEDVLQDAVISAFRFYDGFIGENPRGWLLKVVRNKAYSFLQRNRARKLDAEFDEQLHGDRALFGENLETPEESLQRSDRQCLIEQAVEALPVEFREVFVLREIEGLSYKEIAQTAHVPIGTVMSRLSRARQHLRTAIAPLKEAV